MKKYVIVFIIFMFICPFLCTKIIYGAESNEDLSAKVEAMEKNAYRVEGTTQTTDSATRADALSTGVFVLGLEKGMNLIEKLSDVEGIIIYEDADSRLSTETSSGMEALFKKNIKDFPEGIESDVIMLGS